MSGASASVAPPKPGGPIRAAALSEKWRRLRLIPLAFGAGSLLVGLWVGLARLGLTLPGGMPALAEFHGALMISGFLGTVISLERAVAIGRWWGYPAPTLSATGAAALIVGAPAFAGGAFLLAGIALASISATIVPAPIASSSATRTTSRATSSSSSRAPSARRSQWRWRRSFPDRALSADHPTVIANLLGPVRVLPRGLEPAASLDSYYR